MDVNIIFIALIGCSFRPGQGTILIFYDSPVPVHTGSRLTDPGYSVPGEVHGFPEDLCVDGRTITDEIYIGSRLHSNPGQKQASLSSGILPGPRRQINLGLEYLF